MILSMLLRFSEATYIQLKILYSKLNLICSTFIEIVILVNTDYFTPEENYEYMMYWISLSSFYHLQAYFLNNRNLF